MRVGATYLGKNQCEFRVWAPWAKQVKVVLRGGKSVTIPLESEKLGYWSGQVNAVPGTAYWFELDKGKRLPDPASQFQPKGVHGPSQIVDHTQFKWQDKIWQGIAASNMIIYELHVGTFTSQGTLDAVIPRLTQLKELGINTLEIMPVAACPGKRNWGYDGVYPYAVQDHYGGPEALKRLVNAAHKLGLSVMLDVVYNHLGPEGNYLGAYGPYFSKRYKVPWGEAINFDDQYSDEVRNYFIQNALHWFDNYRIDALRLDAIQAIFDQSAYPFLAELSDQVKIFSQKQGRHFCLIVESDLNESRVHQPVVENGLGMDASWCDDLHHSLHALFTGERQGYYRDYGSFKVLSQALRDGYVFQGQISQFRKRRYGSSRQQLPGKKLVVYDQNHDQVGNRCNGERISQLVSPEAVRCMAAMTLLSPYIPMLFMGEEYGETAPFLFFADHSDKALKAAVRQGRKNEFSTFNWKQEPPDPFALAVFKESRLDWELRRRGAHKKLLAFYRKLMEIRKTVLDCQAGDHVLSVVKDDVDKKIITLDLKRKQTRLFCVFHCDPKQHVCSSLLPQGNWICILDSEDSAWGGRGCTFKPGRLSGQSTTLQAFQVVVFQQEDS
ncbi:malto-oligosyltrehalose trehalohydrolase [bacterium]|nr:malto-oligosyltrehalose trehalohydrolase [bacterium]